MRNWAAQSKIYLIFTSYKLVRNGEMCRGQSGSFLLSIDFMRNQRIQGTNIIKVIEYFYWKPQEGVLYITVS